MGPRPRLNDKLTGLPARYSPPPHCWRVHDACRSHQARRVRLSRLSHHSSHSSGLLHHHQPQHDLQKNHLSARWACGMTIPSQMAEHQFPESAGSDRLGHWVLNPTPPLLYGVTSAWRSESDTTEPLCAVARDVVCVAALAGRVEARVEIEQWLGCQTGNSGRLTMHEYSHEMLG